MQLEEAKMARQAAQQQGAVISAALATSERELEVLRGRYAELYLTSWQQQQELENLELRVAGLLTDREDNTFVHALDQAVRSLEQQREIQQELGRQVSQLESCLNSMLEILQPSRALCRNVDERLAALKDAVRRSGQSLSSVAGRDGDQTRRDKCRVLAVNDDLQVVVLDGGSRNGLRPGFRWCLIRDGKVLARLRVIEVRVAMSAAVVVQGSFTAIGPGAVLRPSDSHSGR